MGAKDVSILDGQGAERLRPVTDLMVGDRFVVRPGEKVAADGVVESGQAVVDCRSMTGESTPIEVGPGARVIGGTVAMDGRLVVCAESVGADTQLSQMLDLVERRRTRRLRSSESPIGSLAISCQPSWPLRSYLGRLATERRGRRAGPQRPALGPDHRLSVCARPGDADGPGGRIRSKGSAGIFFKGYEAVESSGSSRHRALRQDRNDH